MLQPLSPPFDAEQRVLGIFLVDTQALAYGSVRGQLSVEDFGLTEHRLIYRTMVALIDEGKPTSIDFVAQMLGHALDTVGGTLYLTTLSQEAPVSTALRHYLDLVQEQSEQRRLEEETEAALRGPKTPQERIEQLREGLSRVERMHRRLDWDRRADVMGALVDRVTGPETPESAGIPTGIMALDAYIGGMKRKQLITFGARTGIGKTSIAVSIAHAVAVTGENPVAFFSLEMSEDEIAEKFEAIDAGVPHHRLVSHELSELEAKQVRNAAARIKAAPLFVIECPGVTVAEIHRTAREIDLAYRLSLVIVDYLQFVKPQRTTESRVQDVSQIARDLKTMAVELNVPVLALAQLNRQVESRAGAEPTLADLKESGEIEQTSNVVALLWRAGDGSDDTTDVQELNASIAKNRMGKRGKVTVGFRGDYMQVVDLERWTHEPF